MIVKNDRLSSSLILINAAAAERENGTDARSRVGEDAFEIYLRYRYMKGCIFCIFLILRYRYH